MADTSTDYLFSLYHNNDIIPKEVEHVIVQPTVTRIKDRAFEGRNLLKSIHIPNSVTQIGYYTFKRCRSLVAINIPNSVTKIGKYTFRRCTSLTSVNIPNSVAYIGDYTFSFCTSLITINIPNSVTRIGGFTFDNCTSLTAINIPNSVTRIENGTFNNCYLLILIAIPRFVNIWIIFYAFDNCRSLEQRQLNGRNYHADTEAWLRQRFDNLPLHQAIYNSTNTITTTLLSNIIRQNTSTMLTSTDAMLMTPLHVLCCNPSATAEMIQMLKDASPDAASMRNVLDETPLMMYLKCQKKEYRACHVNGQLLPLVQLLELGIDHKVLEVIWVLYDEVMLLSELERADEVSGLLPFMYGALLSECGLAVVYELAMKRQDLLLHF